MSAERLKLTLVMTVLEKEGVATIAEIAKALDGTPEEVTGLVARLKEFGHVDGSRGLVWSLHDGWRTDGKDSLGRRVMVLLALQMLKEKGDRYVLMEELAKLVDLPAEELETAVNELVDGHRVSRMGDMIWLEGNGGVVVKEEDLQEVRRALQPEVRAKRYARLEALGAFVRHLPLPSSIYAVLGELIEREELDGALPRRTVEKMIAVEVAAAELASAVEALRAVVPALPMPSREMIDLVAKAYEGDGQPLLETIRAERGRMFHEEQYELPIVFSGDRVEGALADWYVMNHPGLTRDDLDVTVEATCVRQAHRHARFYGPEYVEGFVRLKKKVSA